MCPALRRHHSATCIQLGMPGVSQKSRGCLVFWLGAFCWFGLVVDYCLFGGSACVCFVGVLGGCFLGFFFCK